MKFEVEPEFKVTDYNYPVINDFYFSYVPLDNNTYSIEFKADNLKEYKLPEYNYNDWKINL